jgi:hypothetical protein
MPIITHGASPPSAGKGQPSPKEVYDAQQAAIAAGAFDIATCVHCNASIVPCACKPECDPPFEGMIHIGTGTHLCNPFSDWIATVGSNQ